MHWSGGTKKEEIERAPVRWATLTDPEWEGARKEQRRLESKAQRVAKRILTPKQDTKEPIWV